jgi:hypothetical protein
MRHTFFALFPTHRSADAALAELHARKLDRRPTEIRYHEHTLDQGELSLLETDGREGLHRGALVGGVVGAVTASLAFFLLGSGAHWLLALAFGGVTGALAGAFFRGLIGATAPDRKLREWEPALAADGVIVTVTVASRELETQIASLFADFGAREARKPVL